MPAAGEGFVSSHPHRWGTLRVVAMVQRACAEVGRQHGPGQAAVIGALSAREGGRLRPHRSHQSGRDVDIGYFVVGAPAGRFAPAHDANLDVARTWTLLEALLRTGELVYVFVDYALQAALYAHAEARGVDDAALSRWFQYPHGAGNRAGLVRHAAGHRDHLHVRFRCSDDDAEDCAD